MDHYGHSGYSFGYITAMFFLEDSEPCVSFMVNDGLTVGFMADELSEARQHLAIRAGPGIGENT